MRILILNSSKNTFWPNLKIPSVINISGAIFIFFSRTDCLGSLASSNYIDNTAQQFLHYIIWCSPFKNYESRSYIAPCQFYDAWRTSSIASEPPRKWKLKFVQNFYLVCKIDAKINISMNLLMQNFRLFKILQLC